MNKEITNFKQGSFVDFAGRERQVIICAVSRPALDKNGSTAEYGFADVDDEESFNIKGSFGRQLCIGYAVCTPPDEFDINSGMMKAYGCAKSSRGKSIFVTHAGLINSKVVEAILDQELEFLCSNPEAVVYRYSLEKQKFEKAKATVAKFNELSDDEKFVVTAGIQGTNLTHLAKMVKELEESSDYIEEGELK